MSNHKNDNMSEIVYIPINTTSWLLRLQQMHCTNPQLSHQCMSVHRLFTVCSHSQVQDRLFEHFSWMIFGKEKDTNFTCSPTPTHMKIYSQPASIASVPGTRKNQRGSNKLHWLAVSNLSGLNDTLAIKPHLDSWIIPFQNVTTL